MCLPSKVALSSQAHDTYRYNAKEEGFTGTRPCITFFVVVGSQLPGLEVWFQRASDVVRKLQYGDVDLGIVGYDMFCEINGGLGGEELIVLHDALNFGGCHLGLGIPQGGKFANVNSLEELKR
jgi:ATP phosphoribosyltransferase